MARSYTDYIARLRARHGDKFDDSGLSSKFAKWYGRRVEVRREHGGLVRGYVVGTTGWRPSLMLLSRRNASGSSELVDDRDTITRILDKTL